MLIEHFIRRGIWRVFGVPIWEPSWFRVFPQLWERMRRRVYVIAL